MVVSLHPSSLEVTARTDLLCCENNLRTWLVSVQTQLAGQLFPLASAAVSCEVTAAEEEVVEVEYLGQVDAHTAIYRVQELEGAEPTLRDVTLQVTLVPRLHPEVSSFYRLQDPLVSLVGRRYLVHPKYALTLVLDYVRQHDLMTQKVVVCDPFLQNLFGCRWVKIRSLWDEIFKLMSPASPEPISCRLNLSELSKSIESSRSVRVDAEKNLYPEDWNLNPGSSAGNLHRTQTVSGTVSSGSKPLHSSSSRTLKRHRTI